MKASDVRVLPALDPGESYVEPRFLLVETTINERGKAVTTIDHFATDPADKKGWSVKPVAYSVPLAHPAAREWAVVCAARRDVPVVYERDETIESLRRQLGINHG